MCSECIKIDHIKGNNVQYLFYIMYFVCVVEVWEVIYNELFLSVLQSEV